MPETAPMIPASQLIKNHIKCPYLPIIRPISATLARHNSRKEKSARLSGTP